MKKIKNADKGILLFKIGAILFAYTTLVLLLCIFSRSFAESYCRTVSAFLRFLLSTVTGVFPFSLSEVLLFLLQVTWLVYEIALIIKKRFRFKRFLMRIGLFIFAAYFLFINIFGVCYVRRPLEENMGFEVEEITENELARAALYIKGELEKTADKVDFAEGGASTNPHEWKAINEKLDYGFERLEKKYKFLSAINADAKRIVLSPYMTYTHISGVFIPFTAEANVNTNYPEYVVAFSTAHEKAHQRGIAGEDEANFVAFLACLSSQDDYLRYVAYLSMYDYYLEEIYLSDSEMYFDLLNGTDRRILGEMYAYSVFFDKYRDSTASKVADTVNDTYIKTMGDSEGTRSYGRVVKLCTSYLMHQKNFN